MLNEFMKFNVLYLLFFFIQYSEHILSISTLFKNDSSYYTTLTSSNSVKLTKI